MIIHNILYSNKNGLLSNNVHCPNIILKPPFPSLDGDYSLRLQNYSFSKLWYPSLSFVSQDLLFMINCKTFYEWSQQENTKSAASLSEKKFKFLLSLECQWTLQRLLTQSRQMWSSEWSNEISQLYTETSTQSECRVSPLEEYSAE